MKTLSFVPLIAMLLTMLFVSTPLLAHSHGDDGYGDRSLKLSVNAAYALFGALLGKAEFRVGENMSIVAHLGYVDNRMSVNRNIQPNPVPWATGRAGVGARFYINGHNMSGFYIDGNVEMDLVGTFSMKQENAPGFGRVGPIIWLLKNSTQVGYSWVTSVGFFAETDAGLEITAPVLGAPDLLQPLASPLTLGPVFRLNLGWAF